MLILKGKKQWLKQISNYDLIDALGGQKDFAFNSINVIGFSTFYIIIRIHQVVILFFQKLIKKVQAKVAKYLIWHSYSHSVSFHPSHPLFVSGESVSPTQVHSELPQVKYLTVKYLGRSRRGLESVPTGSGQVEHPCHTGVKRRGLWAPKNKCNLWRFSTAMDYELAIICHYYCRKTN